VTSVLLISEIPTPYRIPAFAQVAAHPGIDLHVLFCAESEPDRPWQLDDHYGFSYEVLPGFTPAWRTRRDTFVYELNPSILGVLRRTKHEVLVVSGYSVFAEQVALVWARLTRKPYVLLSESHLGKGRPVWVRAVKRAFLPQLVGHAAAGLATGSAAAEYLRHYGLDGDRIRIFPNTIDVAAAGSAADAARAQRGDVIARFELPERFILYVGRLVARKGVEDLLEAHRQLSAVPLVVVGDGPLRDKVATAPNVRWLGFRSPIELQSIYGVAALVVVPSRDEPWGVAVNEALAAGVPVVASDAVGASVDLITPGMNGLVFRSGDIEHLAESMTRALDLFDPPIHGGRVEHWDYSFATEQFVEAMTIATSSSAQDAL
jgi:glycosyltransferase involved in cell wall biosynthesis